LGKSWKNGKSSCLGLSVAGYSNLFYVYGPQSPAAWCNGPAGAQYQGNQVADVLTYIREHGKKRVDVVKEAETKWSQQAKGIAGHTLLPKVESWQLVCNVPGAVREPLFFLGGVGTYLGILEDVKRKAYEGFVLS
jgi:hypothetical protein